MYKKTMLLMLLVVSNSAQASTYNTKCMNDNGKFSSCKVTIENSQVVVSQSKNNIVIGKKQITNLTMGEYSRRRVAEAAFITPWLMFSKKVRDQIGIEYKSSEGNQVVLIESKKKYGMPLKMQLQTMTGLKFVDASQNTEWKEKAN